MKSRPSASLVRVDRRLSTPLFRQVYQRIRNAVLDGTLAPGARLPSSRSLAGQLSIARGTIELAYALLVDEGYVAGMRRTGTIVNAGLSRKSMSPGSGRRSYGSLAELGHEFVRPRSARPFQIALPALDEFPRKLWARLIARRARGLSAIAMVSQDPAGYAPLRQAISGYLAIARGVRCPTDQVLITAGYQGAVGLFARTLLSAGNAVWFENPGYFRARDALALAGAEIVPVPVDQDGLDVGIAMRRSPRARVAVVTPSHQCPLGVMLSLPRRLELLAWAAKTGAWIIEDDYDSEFRYRGRPLPALKSLDDAGRVFYAGSFSKVLSPGLRLGYLVVPSSEVERFQRVAALFAPSPSLLDQMVVADFMIEGHFARHVKRMRKLYAERRKALISALRRFFGDEIVLDAPPGGMHVIARFVAREDDVVMAARAQRTGLAPFALSLCTTGGSRQSGLLLSFTNIPVEAAEREVQRLHRSLR